MTLRWNDSVPGLLNHPLLGSALAAPLLGAADSGDGAKITLLWVMVILSFGVLMMVCVLLLLKREPTEVAVWEPGSSAVKSSGYLQHLSRLLRAIRAINSVIISDRQVDQMLQKACRTLTETRGYKMAWIGLIGPNSKRVVPAAQAGFEDGYLDEVEVTWDDSPTGRGPTGQAIKTGEPSVMRDIEVAPEFQPWRKQAMERGYRSSASLPLRFENRVLGALSVYSEMTNAFDIEEIGLLQEVSDHLAYAIGSIQLEEELRVDRQHLQQLVPVEVRLRARPARHHHGGRPGRRHRRQPPRRSSCWAAPLRPASACRSSTSSAAPRPSPRWRRSCATARPSASSRRPARAACSAGACRCPIRMASRPAASGRSRTRQSCPPFVAPTRRGPERPRVP